MTIKLIVGLSNPGLKYIETRHNIGSWYLNLLANHYSETLKYKKKFYGYTGRFILNENTVHLLIPTTFMNLSGKSVLAMSKFYSIKSKEILIVHDELDLLPGDIRLKFGGNYGGHNGLKDIITNLGNKNIFFRLSVGIGRPIDKNRLINFVLSKPMKKERQLIYKALLKGILCTKILINKNFNK